MTYTEQLTRDYAAIRARLYGSEKRAVKINRPEPQPEPEREPMQGKISRYVQSEGCSSDRRYYRTFGNPIKTLGARWREILNEVAEKHDVCPCEMLGDGKASAVAIARFECWARLRDETAYSFPQIAKFFGKDHSTILHGVKRWREMARGT